MNALALLTAAMLAIVGLSMTAEAAGMDDGQRTITISATGSVLVKPDIVLISTGVSSEAETARDALDENSRLMRQVVSTLKDFGITGRDIQTTDFGVHPRYKNYRDGRPPEVTGYRVTNSVRIRVRDIAKLGEILDEIVSLGSNQIGGIQFDVSEADALTDEARKRAIEEASRKAKLYAEAAGEELGEVLRIEEHVSGGGPRPMAMESTRMAAAAAPPIEAGASTLQVRVTVVWAIE